jgi:RES domain
VSERPLPRPPLTVEIERLAAGTELVRVHHARFGPTEFNATARPPARFRPFGDPVVATMFAARDSDTALAESVFHDVPVRGTRQIARAALRERVLSHIAPTRELRLVALHGYGLQRLGITHGELIESGPTAYSWTAVWGQALHAAAPEADGLTWIARRFTGRPSLMLFGDRMTAGELTVTSQPLELWHGPGLQFVEQAAQQADIALLL